MRAFDAVRGVSAIRIEMLALLRHHPHTLSGAGRTRSDCVSQCACVCESKYNPGSAHVYEDD